MQWSVDAVKDRCVHLATKYPHLTTAKDDNGRSIMDLATPATKQAINALFLWFGRYRITSSTPEHTSATCFVFKAVDEGYQNAAGIFENVAVAIKLMRVKSQFKRETESRAVSDFDPKYVVNVLNAHDLTDGPEVVDVDMSAAVTKQMAESLYCIAMPLADKNMWVCTKQEKFSEAALRSIFTQLIDSVTHVHDKGMIHGDIKTLNLVRTGPDWKLIDLDASCMIDKDSTGFKSSSAYVPPEAIFVDMTSKFAVVRSAQSQEEWKQNGCVNFELLIAHPSFDVWSLGCVFYQLCHDENKPLFDGGRDDNLQNSDTPDNNLWVLAEWSDELKTRKLAGISNLSARNLLSQMLTKEPTTRPTLSRVLAHPFISQKTAGRLPGVQPEFDVFISYRVDSDADHAQHMYDLLTAQGRKVWFDKVCLEHGKNWREGFCAGLCNSKAFVCLASRDAICNPAARQSFTTLTADSPCDNVLLEYRLALELRAMGMITYIAPVFVGDSIPLVERLGVSSLGAVHYSKYFPSEFPDVSVRSVEAELKHHLAQQLLGEILLFIYLKC